jgi:hypothetical protein
MNVKVQNSQGQFTKLVPLQNNAWSLQGSSRGVYLLDVIVGMTGSDVSGAYETLLVILAKNEPIQPVNLVTFNNWITMIKTIVNTDVKVIIEDDKDTPEKPGGWCVPEMYWIGETCVWRPGFGPVPCGPHLGIPCPGQGTCLPTHRWDGEKCVPIPGLGCGPDLPIPCKDEDDMDDTPLNSCGYPLPEESCDPGDVDECEINPAKCESVTPDPQPEPQPDDDTGGNLPGTPPCDGDGGNSGGPDDDTGGKLPGTPPCDSDGGNSGGPDELEEPADDDADGGGDSDSGTSDDSGSSNGDGDGDTGDTGDTELGKN